MKIVKESLEHTFTRNIEDKLSSLGVGILNAPIVFENLTSEIISKALGIEILIQRPNENEITFEVTSGSINKDETAIIFQFNFSKDGELYKSVPSENFSLSVFDFKIKTLKELKDAINNVWQWDYL
jgi:hypothetical protein